MVDLARLHRPRLLIATAAIMVAGGGGLVRPLRLAAEREAALDRARRTGADRHVWSEHVAALADLIVSARSAAPRPHLRIVFAEPSE